MKDADGVERKVILNKPKPQDFEMSEQIVVTGELQNDAFMANEILMKCPSKYKDEELSVKESTL
jgi:cytochrome c-type biogenesis protein CcmE